MEEPIEMTALQAAHTLGYCYDYILKAVKNGFPCRREGRRIYFKTSLIKDVFLRGKQLGDMAQAIRETKEPTPSRFYSDLAHGRDEQIVSFCGVRIEGDAAERIYIPRRFTEPLAPPAVYDWQDALRNFINANRRLGINLVSIRLIKENYGTQHHE